MSLIHLFWIRIVPRTSRSWRISALEDQQPGQRDDERRYADLGHDRPLSGAEGADDGDGEEDREECAYRRDDREGPVVVRPRELELGDGDRGEPAQVSDREIDLTEQQHEDDAVREHARARGLDDDVVEVVGGEEDGRLGAEEDDDQHEPDDDRQDAEIALRRLSYARRATLFSSASCTSG